MHIATAQKNTILQFVNLKIHDLFRYVEADKAVIFALSSRALQMITGPLALLLITHYFTPQVQGFYYTFLSLIALQSFVELGLYLVIINVASHEWAHLAIDKDGYIVGKSEALSRLVSLGRFIFKWYSAASVIFMIGVGIAGYVFLSGTPNDGIIWQAPWVTSVVITGLLLLALPFTSLLEGCNQIETVNKFRIYQSGYGSLAMCLTIFIGGELWAAVALSSVNLLCNLYLQLIRYRRFFKSFYTPHAGPIISWRMDIWPMQWRLGLSGVVNYFAFSLVTPIMFHYHGSIVAGQMGMTWQVMGALGGLALAWVYTKVPRYGILIAQQDYAGLDRYWFRCSFISVMVFSAGAIVLWILVLGLNTLQMPFAKRILPPCPTGLFLIAGIFMQISQCQTAYLRAHKEEPIVVMSVTVSLLNGILVLVLGSKYGPTAVSASYMVVMLLGLIWETHIWLCCRKRWHK